MPVLRLGAVPIPIRGRQHSPVSSRMPFEICGMQMIKAPTFLVQGLRVKLSRVIKWSNAMTNCISCTSIGMKQVLGSSSDCSIRKLCRPELAIVCNFLFAAKDVRTSHPGWCRTRTYFGGQGPSTIQSAGCSTFEVSLSIPTKCTSKPYRRDRIHQ